MGVERSVRRDKSVPSVSARTCTSVVACKCDVCSHSVQVGICQHHSVLCEHHSVLCEWAQCTYVVLYGAQYIHTYIHTLLMSTYTLLSGLLGAIAQ